MYGSCAFLRLFFVLSLLGSLLASQTASAQSSQKATVINDEALVYKDADFDAPVISHLRPGMVFDISKAKRGPFYKIRLQPGLLGWIADTDVRPNSPLKKTPKEKDLLEEKKKEELLGKDFLISRYRGGELEWINYTEQTMGKQRSAGMIFYGLKFSGIDTAVSGAVYADSNLMFHIGAPGYYTQATGEGASGFLAMGDLLLETAQPINPKMLYFYGLGPMVRYSRYSLALPSGTSSTSYTAEDLTLGVDFNLGLAVRWKAFALRGEAKYYWEKNRYYGLGLAVQYQF